MTPRTRVETPDLGAELDATPDRPPFGWGLDVYAHTLPPFPGADVIPFVTVPAPPTLNPGMAEDVMVYAVWTAWCGARARIGLPNARVPPSRLANMRAYPQLARAAHRLLAEGIPPAGWVQHTMHEWHERVRAAGRHSGRKVAVAAKCGDQCPHLSWAFSAPRLAPGSRSILAFHARPCLTVAQVHMLPMHRALLDRWMSAQDALAALPLGATPADAQAAVESVLGTPDAWARDVAAAQARVAGSQRRLSELAARGEWIWR